MPIFSSVSCSKPCSGYTLLEVLAVLVIVSLMVSITVVNLPAFLQTDHFDQESDRLRVMFSMIRDRAAMRSDEYGFRVNTATYGEQFEYAFYLYDEQLQTWEMLEPPFSTHTLPRGIRLNLSVEDDVMQLPHKDEESPPPVLVLSSGEITPFELLMENVDDPNLNSVLSTDGYSEVDWEIVGDDD